MTSRSKLQLGNERELLDVPVDTATEWLEADGLGGFASGTTSTIRTRRYHALLLTAARPPSDRFVLVHGFVGWIETEDGREDFTPQHYAPGVTTEASVRIVEFNAEPWPTWRFRTRNGAEFTQEILAERGSPRVLLRFRWLSGGDARLVIRPLLSGRGFHELQRENQSFDFTPTPRGRSIGFTPYAGVPAVQSWSNGAYAHAPDWYRNFRYAEERARGLDCDEDLAAPGELSFDLSKGPALWLLSAGSTPIDDSDAENLLRREEERRAAIGDSLLRAAEAYLVARGNGRTVIAGYPWFSDWGRDTFIALRGLCLTTGRFHEARSILLEWAGAVSEGMLPNRFADRSGEQPEYNSVDASLWYVVAAGEFLEIDAKQRVLSVSQRTTLEGALRAIVLGYARGTRYGIRSDADGLLCAGAPLAQLTWMDAKIGDHVVTPRSGKPVEVQALWLNALHTTRRFSSDLTNLFERARQSFVRRFWDASRGTLYDVIDVNHEPGTIDASLRPNQIFAAGGLPYTPLATEQARSVVDVVERALWTPLGLRSLDPANAAYRSRYEGDVWSRDTAYHQGTVWPWLLGPFVEAWVRVRGKTVEAKREARARFLRPLEVHRSRAGVGHVSEIADAEPPFTPRGCPFQAWSVSELVRLELGVLAD